MIDVVVTLLLIAGGWFAFVAGLGVLRMPDVYIRMHASTKAGTLGVGLILLGVLVFFGDLSVGTRAIAAIAFILITAPVAAHMIGRAAYRTETPMWEGTLTDELTGRHREYQYFRPPAELTGDEYAGLHLPSDKPET